MPKKPTRTINILDKGSNYLLVDSADATPLYNCHWNGHSAPHMTVTRLPGKEPVGNATYFDKKKGGFFATASDIHLTIHSRNTPMNKDGGFFSTDKRTYSSVQGTKFVWKGGFAASQYLRLEDDKGRLWVDFKNTAYTGSVMGVFNVYVEPLGEEMLDEIVVGGLAMISEQKTSMTNTAAAISSAGG